MNFKEVYATAEQTPAVQQARSAFMAVRVAGMANKVVDKEVEVLNKVDDKATQMKQNFKEGVDKINSGIDNVAYGKPQPQGPVAGDRPQPQGRGNEAFFNQIQANGRQIEQSGYEPKAISKYS